MRPLFGVISGGSLTLRYSAEESPGSRRADPKRFSLDMGELSVLASIPFPTAGAHLRKPHQHLGGVQGGGGCGTSAPQS